MKYDDLLNVPYKEGGRDKNGYDCYGLTLECLKRNGESAPDFAIKKIDVKTSEALIEKSNFYEVPFEKRRKGDVVQCEYNNFLHLAFLVETDLAIHTSKRGVIISPLLALKNIKILRVKK